MDEQQALRALSLWLGEGLPDAGAKELGRCLRRLRARSLRRRRQARRLLTEALLSPLPPARRRELEPVLRWLFGQQWLPPPRADLVSSRAPVFRARSLLF